MGCLPPDDDGLDESLSLGRREGVDGAAAAAEEAEAASFISTFSLELDVLVLFYFLAGSEDN